MLNLQISKSHDLLKMMNMTITRNDWVINGKVIRVKEEPNGYWLRVKSSVKMADLYNLDKLEFDCFLPKEIAATSYKKDSYYKKLHAVGKFHFTKKKEYFLVSQLLV